MKAWDFDAVMYDGEVFCVEHLPEGATDNLDGQPIFADSEWTHFPVCCVCGHEHTYVSLTQGTPS